MVPRRQRHEGVEGRTAVDAEGRQDRGQHRGGPRLGHQHVDEASGECALSVLGEQARIPRQSGQDGVGLSEGVRGEGQVDAVQRLGDDGVGPVAPQQQRDRDAGVRREDRQRRRPSSISLNTTSSVTTVSDAATR